LHQVVLDPKHFRRGKTLAQGVQSKLVVMDMLSAIGFWWDYTLDQNTDVESAAGPTAIANFSEEYELAIRHLPSTLQASTGCESNGTSELERWQIIAFACGLDSIG